MHQTQRILGTIRCADCGALVPAGFGHQTGQRCLECWKDRHPLATLEIINASVKFSARAIYRSKVVKKPPKRHSHHDHIVLRAREAAMLRMSRIFPDLYAMLYDEERIERGLPPIAHYESIDFEDVSAKTLGFEAVYDALESRGVSDA